MKTLLPVLRFIFLGFVCGVCACASPAHRQDGESDASGSVGLELELDPGVTLGEIDWTIHNPALLPIDRRGQVDVSGSQAIAFVVGGLPAGSGYSVMLTGATGGPSPLPCAGSAPFDIGAGAQTTAAVHVVCGAPPPDAGDNGSIIVNGQPTIAPACPVVSSLSASPSEVNIGSDVTLVATAVGVDGASAPVSWAIATGPGSGSFGDATSSTTTFTCTAAGAVTVTATAKPAGGGTCTPWLRSAEVTISCDAVVRTVSAAHCQTSRHQGPLPTGTTLPAPTVPATVVVNPGGLTPIDLSSSMPFSIVRAGVTTSLGVTEYFEIDLPTPGEDVLLGFDLSGSFGASFSVSFSTADDGGDISGASTTVIYAPGPPPPPIEVEGVASFSQCVALADPHIRTFDGLLYDCQPWGEVTLVRSTTPNDLDVQIRTRPWGSRLDVSITVAVAAEVAGNRVAFYDDGTMTLDAASTNFGGGVTALSGGGTVYGVADGYIVVWPDGSQMWVDFGGGYMGVRIFLRNGTGRHLMGLCGDDDGSLANDLTTSDGQTTLSSPAAFDAFYGTLVKSWRVAADDSDSLFDYPPLETTANFTDLTFPHFLATTQGLDTSAAVAACASAAAGWQNACVLDVTLTGDPRFASEYTSTSLPPALSVGTITPPQCPAPVIVPTPGTVVAGTGVLIVASGLPENAIHYTTDGSAPGDESPVDTGALIPVNQSETIRAIASLPGACTDSTVTSGAYTVAAAQSYDYVDWTSASPATGTAAGTTHLLDGSSIGVTFTALTASQTAGTLFGAQINGVGTNYWIPPTPYVGAVVTNAPPNPDILQLTGGLGQTYTVGFSQPVANLIMPIVSLGGAVAATYDFDAPFRILTVAPGFFGGTTTSLTALPNNILRGAEGSGTIQFTGTVSSVSWTVPTAETWHGFTFGLPSSTHGFPGDGGAADAN